VRYFVIGEDGQKYGPADIATLQNWVGEGRLLPTQQVEEEGSGIRMAAAAVNGLKFPTAPTQGPYAPGPAAGQYRPQEGAGQMGSNYNRPMAGNYGDNGQGDVTAAWICFGIGVFCFGIILEPMAIYYGNRAISKGNDGGNLPKILAIIFLVLNILGIIAYVALIGVAASSGALNRPPTMMR
jgi:hypothetical protein